MKERKKSARLVLDARILASLLVLLLPANGDSQSVEFTTYMPSPVGNLRRLRTTEETFLALALANTPPPANRVGIGTSNPTEKLHILGNSDGGFLLTGTRPRLKIQDTGGIMYAMEGTGDRLDFCRFGLACDMTVRWGRVGIGTSAPQQALHVNGGIRTEGTRMDIWNKDGAGMFWWRAKGVDPQAPNEGASPFLGVRMNASDQAEYVHLAPGAADGLIVFRNGHVGIGVGNTDPGRKFQVNGLSVFNGNIGMYMAPRPGANLDLGAGFFAAGRVTLAQNAGTTNRTWHLDNNGGWLRIFDQQRINFAGDGRDRIMINPNGHIFLKTGGITLEANTSPSIHLAGNGRLSLSDTARIETFGGRVLIYNDAAFGFQGTIIAQRKFFRIQHPLDPKNKDLVHGSLEGPELGVYYRGQGRLVNSRAVIKLPHYFEALTSQENRTVLLTPQFDSSESISYLAASEVKNGQFAVRAIDDKNRSQKFYWEVKAVRADTPPLKVEVDRELQLSSSKP